MPFPNRKSLRLREYDYSTDGAYFVTICVRDKKGLLGEILDGNMILSNLGQVVKSCWCEIPSHFSRVQLDAIVIMPNHLHGIILISSLVGATHASPLQMSSMGDNHPRRLRTGSLGAIIGSFKSAASKKARTLGLSPRASLWQRNYFEHVIRNEKALDKIREYITTNPSRWYLDQENPQRLGTDDFDIWLEKQGRQSIPKLLKTRH